MYIHIFWRRPKIERIRFTFFFIRAPIKLQILHGLRSIVKFLLIKWDLKLEFNYKKKSWNLWSQNSGNKYKISSFIILWQKIGIDKISLLNPPQKSFSKWFTKTHLWPQNSGSNSMIICDFKLRLILLLLFNVTGWLDLATPHSLLL